MRELAEWADELRDRIRDISLALDDGDVAEATRAANAAESACRLHHERTVRAARDDGWPREGPKRPLRATTG